MIEGIGSVPYRLEHCGGLKGHRFCFTNFRRNSRRFAELGIRMDINLAIRSRKFLWLANTFQARLMF